jgi:hypothetical protein
MRYRLPMMLPDGSELSVDESLAIGCADCECCEARLGHLAGRTEVKVLQAWAMLRQGVHRPLANRATLPRG